MSDSAQPALAARSPSSRKSLSVVTSSRKSHAAHRKRAKSMASTNPDELTPRSRRRRSLVPKKSILKGSNAANTAGTASSQLDLQAHNPLEDITANFTKTSIFNPERRVSFAPNAHVRLIPKEVQIVNESSSPPPSPGDSNDSSPDTSQENMRLAADPSPLKDYKPKRRSSLRTSIGDGEGEASMELASDASFLSEQSNRSPEVSSRRESMNSEGSSMDTADSQDDMDITLNTDVTSRLSLPAGRRSSVRAPSRRASSAPLNEEKPTEYTVTLEESLKKDEPPSATWLALRAITNGSSEEKSQATADMDIATAAQRLLMAGKDIPIIAEDEEEDMTISSGGDSTGSLGGKTMNLTGLIDGLRRASAAIVSSLSPAKTSAPENKNPPPESARESQSSAPPSATHVPASTPASTSIFRPKSNVIFTPRTQAVSSSPTKPQPSPSKKAKPHSFSAAFAPPTVVKPRTPSSTMNAPSMKSPARQTPLKRPFVADASTPVSASPAKKLIVESTGEPRLKAIPRPSPQKTGVESSPMKKATPTRVPLNATPKKDLHPILPSTSSIAPQAPPIIIMSTSTSTPVRVPLVDKRLSSIAEVSESPSPAKSTQPTIVPVQSKNRVSSQPEHDTPKPAPTPTRLAVSPYHTPVAKKSITESMVMSPWLGRNKRQSAVTDREDDEEHDIPEEDEYDATTKLQMLSEEELERLPHSIDEVLKMFGGGFMDNIVARRRSTMALRSADQFSDTPATVADYATAIILDLPMLNYYDFTVKHLQSFIDTADIQQREVDELVRENPPTFFIEIASSNEEQLEECRIILETLRHLVRSRTRIQWYGWRYEGISDLCQTLETREKAALRDLNLARSLAPEISENARIIELEHTHVMEELERERVAISEIESCDPKELAAIKAGIAENTTELKMLEEELAQLQSEIDAIMQREEECKAEQKKLHQRMELANRICSSANCQQSAFEETHVAIDLLELSSGWKALKISPILVNLEYSNQFTVHMPCQNWIPVLDACTISAKIVPSSSKRRGSDWLPEFSSFAVECAQQRLKRGKFGRRSVRKIMGRMASFWSSCEVLRQEIMLLRSRYPVMLVRDGKSLAAKVPLLSEKLQAKVVMEFGFDAKRIEQWPLSIHETPVQIQMSYVLNEKAQVNIDAMLQAAHAYMRSVTSNEEFGVLLDACVEADALFS
ncbi:hypothetical protein FRC17_009419 [Serendipita sp. 399]|nr:hypothetical protein FRC17_009419 [Serendipita sp. 399]